MKKILIIILLLCLAFVLSLCDNGSLDYALYRESLPFLAIKSVDVIGIEQVQIVLSHSVHNSTAEGINNYHITSEDDRENVAVISAEQDIVSPQVIILTTDILEADKTYCLTIYNLTSDYAQPVPDEGLTGMFIGITTLGTDTSPPNYVLPEDGYEVIVDEILLQWTSCVGASIYYVEISTDVGFTNQVENSPFSSYTTTYVFTIPESGTYYWRVRADVTEEGEYSNMAGDFFCFGKLSDTIYVYCPAGESCSPYAGIGTVNEPLRSIEAAVEKAYEVGIDKIKVAARGSGDAYYEDTIPVFDGLELKAGYTSDFSEADRDINGNETIISGNLTSFIDTAVISIQNIVNNTVLEGFTINAADSTISCGIKVNNTNSKLIVTNNTIRAGDSAKGDSESYCIYALDSDAVFSENHFLFGDSRYSYGFYVRNGEPYFEDNTFVSEEKMISSSYAIYAEDCKLTIANNYISTNNDTSLAATNYGIYH